jgi:hypothetical protein
MLCLAIPSLLVYAAVLVAARFIPAASRRAAHKHPAGSVRADIKRPGYCLMKFASAVLCSGSYVLCDVRVPSERVRVKITLV